MSDYRDTGRTIIPGTWSDAMVGRETSHPALRVEPTSAVSAFGELMFATNTPVVQLVAQYNQLHSLEQFTLPLGLASTGTVDSMFFASTDAAPGSAAAITSRRALTYRAGQGASARFTAKFGTPVEGNFQFAGLIGVSDRLTFGYENTVFGIHYRKFGKSEVQDLQVTTPAGGDEDATVTVGGVAFTVPLTAGTVEDNAFEIAMSLQDQTDLYDFDSVGDTVKAIGIRSGVVVSAFDFTSATAVATWSQAVAGVASEDEFIPQTDWSEGVSFKITPDKLTPYQISFEYLGGGGIDFFAENPETSNFELVHRLIIAGTGDKPSLLNPSFKIGWATANSTSTTSTTVYGASAAGFIQGLKRFTNPTSATSATTSNVGTTPTNIVTVKCRNEFGGIRNFSEIVMALSGASSDSSKNVSVQLIRNATFSSPLNYRYKDEFESVALIATAPVAITGGDVLAAGSPGELNLDVLNQVLIPGESVTIAMNVSQTPVSEMSASLIWFEDQ